MSEEEKPRWRYRFDNFDRAFVLLREAMETLDQRPLSQLEREGVIQRFEYSWELAWKTLSDYLAHQGVVVSPTTPRSVIRAAFEAGLIEKGELWMAALDARNKMSHTYNFKLFEVVIEQLQTGFIDLFVTLHDKLLTEAVNDDASSR